MVKINHNEVNISYTKRTDYIIQGISRQNMKEKRDERLESIKRAHKSAKADSSSRMEDYLEVISELVELKGYANTLDISRYMNVSAPSVTKMLQRLDENGYLEYEKYRGINLTTKGNAIAATIRQKHGILLEFFKMLGIDHAAANKDAEGIEHHLNPKTIKQLRAPRAFRKRMSAFQWGQRATSWKPDKCKLRSKAQFYCFLFHKSQKSFAVAGPCPA